ncbi:MAG: acylphosphatase [Phycisphaerae bacterium]
MNVRIARLAHFEGYVQGVGFRYTALNLARRYSVYGYAMNMPDGSVEVHAEGIADQVDNFIQTLKNEMSEYIQKTTTQELPPTGLYDRFTIKY